jgi:single-strand DNA-binding protein
LTGLTSCSIFDITVFGAQGENCARFLGKGRPLAVDGRLEWREWEDQNGNRRQSVEIVADAVQFLGAPDTTNGAAQAEPAANAADPDDDLPF